MAERSTTLGKESTVRDGRSLDRDNLELRSKQPQFTVRGRSRPLNKWRRLLATVPLLGFTTYVTWANVGWAEYEVWPVVLFFSIVALLVLAIAMAGIYWRSFRHLSVADGLVLAIVPVYNERPELVHDTVWSLINQTRPPDEIHVVDDGSDTPVETFDHPLVHWHRTENQGKRHAQAHALRRFQSGFWDFILTVDSDSVCDPDAVEEMLRSMSNPAVQASTGMILVRNWRQNLLTHFIDINVVSSCLMFRMFRSWFGLVTPTSGALALYRSGLVYDNLDDYVSSGTAGDDRRLSFYALLRGQVVGVPEAVVETELPDSFRGTFYQRLRWSKSAWLGIPFVLTNLNLGVVLLYMYPLVFAIMWPFTIAVLSKISIDYGNPVLIYGLIFQVVVSLTLGSIYVLYRPDFTLRQRLGQLALTPIYPILGLILLRPAAYWALTKLRSTSWHTRGAAHTPVTEAGQHVA